MVRAHRGVDNGEPMESDDELGKHLECGVIRAAMLHAHEVFIEAGQGIVLGALRVLVALLSDDGKNTTHSSLESRGASLHPAT